MSDIKQFENREIRSVWDREQVDLKRKMQEEEGANQLYEKIVQLKFRASDGKMYKTDAANMQGTFRIIQSIPSPGARAH